MKKAQLREERETARQLNTVCAYCGTEVFRYDAWKKRHEQQYGGRDCYLAYVRGEPPLTSSAPEQIECCHLNRTGQRVR